MATTVVHFTEVGRGKKTWTVDASGVPADDLREDGLPSEDWLTAQVVAGRALMSQDVSVEYSESSDAHFTVYVGFGRNVGSGFVERVLGVAP